jgi:hypothetical protein
VFGVDPKRIEQQALRVTKIGIWVIERDTALITHMPLDTP